MQNVVYNATKTAQVCTYIKCMYMYCRILEREKSDIVNSDTMRKW